jgi:hypothetical protein
MTADLGSPPLSGHKICPLWTLTRLQPDVQLPSATSAPSSLHQMTMTHSTSLPYMSVPYPKHTLTLFPCFFPRPAKLPHLTSIPNTHSYILLVRSVCESQVVSFCGNWGPLFHFPPASYKTQNFQLAGYSVRHLFSRSFLAQLIRPWSWRWYVPPKRWLTFNRLHGVISQNKALLVLWEPQILHRFSEVTIFYHYQLPEYLLINVGTFWHAIVFYFTNM